MTSGDSFNAPPPGARPRSGMRRLLRHRTAAGVAVVAVLAGTGAVVWARRGAAAVEYRTAQATLGTVTQTLSLSGNLAPLGETDLDFAVAGRVESVTVQPGDHVTSGQTLATLDTTSLQAALTQAQATLASAQARLSLDEQGPTPQNLAQAQASVASAQVSLRNAQTSLADTRSLNTVTLSQAQQAVASAQAAVASDQATVAADQSRAQADQSNQQAESADQQKLAADQQTLARDQAALAAAQAALQTTQVKVQQSDDQALAAVDTAGVQLANAQASLTALRQGVAPQTIAQDQSQVQSAQVGVDTAQRALSAATLTAPVSGTVGTVGVSAGEQVSAGSGSGGSGSGSGTSGSSAASSGSSGSSAGTHAVTLLSPGAFEVTGSVSDTQVGLVAAGQRARVTPAGSSEAVTGKVTSVAQVATVTSGVATFGVTVALDGSNPALHAGVSASVQIIVNQVVGVLTVPTSAVQNGAVQVLVDGQPQTRQVTTGASDALRTEITAGLNPGDQVVIATVSGTVPTPNAAGGGGGGLFGVGGGGGFRGGGGGGGLRGGGGGGGGG